MAGINRSNPDRDCLRMPRLSSTTSSGSGAGWGSTGSISPVQTDIRVPREQLPNECHVVLSIRHAVMGVQRDLGPPVGGFQAQIRQ